MRRCHRAYLTVGTVVVSAYLVLPAGIPRDIAYFVAGVSCVVAILVGVHTKKPRSRLAWYLLAAGQTMWVSADTLYSWYEDVLDVSPFPSYADVFYLVAYPLLASGLAILVLRRRRPHDLAGLIDSMIVLAALGLLSWVLVAGPILHEADDPLFDRLVAVAYPMGDILLLAMLVRLITSPGVRSMSFRLLCSAIALQVTADTFFAGDLFAGDWIALLDLMWIGSYVLWGAAALHPTMATLSDRASRRTQPFTPRRLAALTLAVLVAPAVLAAELAFSLTLNGWPIVVASVALFLLVVGRMTLAIAEITSTARQRDKLQGDLSFQAVHDSLTGLANRAGVLALIEAALHRVQRAGTPAGLLFIDLDHFKAVNDTLGHRAGDEVLRHTAQRMRQCVRQGDTVGRLGGDEFVVLMEAMSSEEDVVLLADRLLSAISMPLTIDGATVSIGASIGIALSLDAGTDAGQLLHEADVAAYRAKSSGRGRAEVFGERLRRELIEREELEKALLTSLASGGLSLEYQPVVGVADGLTRGYEALLRWHRPGHDLQLPDQFIPTAEKSDLVCELDRWALREATRQLAAWAEAEPERFATQQMAVNISGRHLADPSVVTDVLEALQGAGLTPDRLVLEITETVLVDVPTAVVQLRALRELGVSISIDDFGTGYTSIAQLQFLPVDTLKIDKSFVSFAGHGSTELVKLMINAAQFCGLNVIAEGVETREQLAILEELNCDYAQGYLFARPQPAATILPI